MVMIFVLMMELVELVLVKIKGKVTGEITSHAKICSSVM